MWSYDHIRPAGGAVVCSVLEFVPGLEDSVPVGRRERARASAMARILDVAAGESVRLDGCASLEDGPGLLLLEGVLMHEVVFDGRQSGDVLTSGDLVPSPGRLAETRATCKALTPARLAILGPRWAARTSPVPEIGLALVVGAVAQSKRLVTMSAATHEPQLDARLWRVLWNLADRLGRVHADGVHIEIPLTHDLLAVLARARRPSVSTALGELAGRGLLRRDGRGWVLEAGFAAGATTARSRRTGVAVRSSGHTARRGDESAGRASASPNGEARSVRSGVGAGARSRHGTG